MAGWASHWATWGVEVVTPQMCALRPFNTDHPANGRHLAALIKNLRGTKKVLLAGHSSGALAATLAAAQEPVDGILGLDPVDAEGIGEDAADRLAIPVGALFGEPSQCNAEGNGESMFAPIQDRAWWRVVTADHCSFESPTDRFCTGFCRRGERDDAEIERTVLAMSTAWVLWRGGLDVRGSEWWTPGEERFNEIQSQLEVP
jgi:pimeloyl-ACP methyl ester carboxylesterase